MDSPATCIELECPTRGIKRVPQGASAAAAKTRCDPVTVLARDLFRAGPVLRIVLGDTVWLLRRTRTDRLTLTR